MKLIVTEETPLVTPLLPFAIGLGFVGLNPSQPRIHRVFHAVVALSLLFLVQLVGDEDSMSLLWLLLSVPRSRMRPVKPWLHAIDMVASQLAKGLATVLIFMCERESLLQLSQ